MLFVLKSFYCSQLTSEHYCKILTVDIHQGGGGGPLPGHIGRHAAVVGGVWHLGLQDQEAAGAADDEVWVCVGVYRDPVPEPGHDPGGGLPSRGVAPQLPLSTHLYVGVVGRSLEIFTQI